MKHATFTICIPVNAPSRFLTSLCLDPISECCLASIYSCDCGQVTPISSTLTSPLCNKPRTKSWMHDSRMAREALSLLQLSTSIVLSSARSSAPKSEIKDKFVQYFLYSYIKSVWSQRFVNIVNSSQNCFLPPNALTFSASAWLAFDSPAATKGTSTNTNSNVKIARTQQFKALVSNLH